MPELNFQHLRYFWSVAREGNLTRAAQKLHVTQSSVSVQLQKLEEAIGHALFERRGRRLELTPAGRVALDYADGIFSMGDELLGVLTNIADDVRRTLRVGVLATLSRNLQITFLRPLLNRADAHLVIHSGAIESLVERLERHELDVVLTDLAPVRSPGATWVAHTIDTQPVSLIGHPDPRRPRQLSKLLTREPLVLPLPQSGIRAGFDALVERLGVRPFIAAEVEDMAMLRLMAREHQGLTVIPPIIVQDELESGVLVEVKQLPGLLETFFALATPRRLPHRLLRELLGPDGRSATKRE